MPILESRVVPDSIVYTDCFASYDLVDVLAFHHRRIDHGKAFVTAKDCKCHINYIEIFCNQAKQHLRRRAASRANTSTTSSRNARGASMVGTTRSFIVGC